jgi:organic hydroperoxide reductase OsmC/OhrA
VLDYFDNAIGVMIERPDGRAKFSEVLLNPMVRVSESSMVKKAQELHQRANEYCFIANSVNFDVKHNPICRIGEC